MDKRTIIAVVLSVIIISGSFIIQQQFFPNTLGGQAANPRQTTSEQPVSEPAAREATQSSSPSGSSSLDLAIRPQESEALEREIPLSTGVFDARFSTRGGVLTSLKFKTFTEVDGPPVEMVFSGDTGVYPFALSLEDYDTSGDVFEQVAVAVPDRMVFERDYVFRELGQDVPFVLRKSYSFKPEDYMIEFRVTIETEQGKRIPIEDYTYAFGPQIGPTFTKLDPRRGDIRQTIYYADGKRRDNTNKVAKQGRLEIEDRVGWAGIAGKYFAVLGVPYISELEIGFDATTLNGLPEGKQHSVYFTRDIERKTEIDDGYKFYIGPMQRKVLERYNDKEANPWRESGLRLEEAVPSSFWGFLSDGLKWLLELYFRLVPNWGVAIILLTLTIKILFFPLTKKSLESTSKMQALSPKLNEIKERYKDNPQKQQQETAALYKREGVNPVGGCLPMLLQLPIFIAMYRLFNSYFELRGAAFIVPWIPDLSSPERLLTLPFEIPFLGDELHLLPFLMLGITFLQQWVTTSHGTQASSQNKMLLYGMPAFFFFIMYNMPSGLLLYWTMQSLLGFLQQFYINAQRTKKADGGTGVK